MYDAFADRLRLAPSAWHASGARPQGGAIHRCWRRVHMKHRTAVAGAASVALAMMTLTTALVVPASAAQPSVPGPTPGAMPNVVPSAITPQVGDGDVRAIAQVGSTMVIGGNFTSVGGQARSRIAAFNATSGALSSFNLRRQRRGQRHRAGSERPHGLHRWQLHPGRRRPRSRTSRWSTWRPAPSFRPGNRRVSIGRVNDIVQRGQPRSTPSALSTRQAVWTTTASSP